MMAENRDDLDHEGVQDDADRGMPSINQRGKSSGGMMQKVVAVGGAIVVVLALIAFVYAAGVWQCIAVGWWTRWPVWHVGRGTRPPNGPTTNQWPG